MPSRQDIKNYKKKLDSRLGQVILLVLVTMATLLCLYGLIHSGAHEPVYTYVNRTHQIVHELETAVQENFGGVKRKCQNNLYLNTTLFERELCRNVTVPNETSASTTENTTGKKWLTSEELADYSSILTKVFIVTLVLASLCSYPYEIATSEYALQTKSTIWGLFTANLVLAALLLPILLIITLGIAEGNYVKLAYRVVLLVCVLFLIAQFLYLIYPLLTGALSFPSVSLE